MEDIKKDALKRYRSIEDIDEESFEQIIEQVIEVTREQVFDELRQRFGAEFSDGYLKHEFIISPEYYLDLNLKAVRFNMDQRKC